METLRSVKNYRLEKVKRNSQGSYAITKEGFKSETQYNGGTVKKALLKMNDSEFLEYAKSQKFIKL